MSSPRRAAALLALALVGATPALAQRHAPAPVRPAAHPAPAAAAHDSGSHPAPTKPAPRKDAPAKGAPAPAHAEPAHAEPAAKPAVAAHGATNARSAAIEAAHSPCSEASAATADNRPVLPGTAGPEYAAFIDPAARIEAGERIRIGCRSYVAPFASLDASAGPISIGAESDVQDNVTISGRVVVLGDRVIVAHGATVIGPAAIGAPGGKPAFVGFNAFVDGATVEEDAMVLHLARVAPGVVVRSGTKVLPGKFVRTQAEADSESLGKIARVVDADRVFMAGVLHVNTSLARHYSELQHLTPSLLRGAGRDPGESDFNTAADLPTFAGRARALPELRNRIIGRVDLADEAERLDSVMGRAVSIRADEGEWFTLGHLAKVQDRVTFHALEHSGIDVGDGDWFGFHTVVHGGSDAHNAPAERTRVGKDVVVKDWAVVFRSTIGDGTVIGVRAYVDGTNLPPKSVVPDRAIIVGGKLIGAVEW